MQGITARRMSAIIVVGHSVHVGRSLLLPLHGSCWSPRSFRSLVHGFFNPLLPTVRYGNIRTTGMVQYVDKTILLPGGLLCDPFRTLPTA